MKTDLLTLDKLIDELFVTIKKLDPFRSAVQEARLWCLGADQVLVDLNLSALYFGIASTSSGIVLIKQILQNSKPIIERLCPAKTEPCEMRLEEEVEGIRVPGTLIGAA